MILTNVLYFGIIMIAGLVAFRLKFLTHSGFVAAMVIGSAIYLGLFLQGLLLLGVFFVTSSLLSVKPSKNKRKKSEDSRRNAWQVIANGGIPAVIAVLYFYFQSQFLLVLFCTAIASANADTWASEIGPYSRNRPIHIGRFRRVDPGTSGAVSLLGTTASLVASLLIALISMLLWDDLTLLHFFFISIFGFMGSVLDTVLGATIQVTYQCDKCNMITESRKHCGQVGRRYKGIQLVDNNVVNFISVLLTVSILFLASIVFENSDLF